jgi:dipeptidyl aminopeptidase/acylaminoacyl peptidase
MLRLLPSATAALLLVPGLLLSQSKSPVTPKDYGKWESLGAATLSPNGQWLAYAVNRVNEENELRLAGGTRDSTIAVLYGSGPIFTADSKWLAYAIGVSPAERDRLTRDKKPIKNSVGFRNLLGGKSEVLAEVQSFRFSADGRFLAMRRYPAEGKRMAELIVKDLAQDTRITFGNVSDFAWADSRALLALTVETEGGVGNATQLWDGTTGTLRVLDASPSLYRALAWRSKGEDLAVVRTRTDSEFRDTTHVVLAWQRVGTPTQLRKELDPITAGIAKEMRIAEHRRPEWAKDGSIVFVGIRPRDRVRSMVAATAGDGNGSPNADSTGSVPNVAMGARRSDSSKAAADSVKLSDVQVWHVNDVRMMAMQKQQEQQDLQRTLLTAWHLGDGKVVQLGSYLLETTRVLEGAKHATETDRNAYAWGTKFGRPYIDVWLIDVKSGERKKVLEKVRHYGGGSATGKRLFWYDGKDYWSYDIATNVRSNLSRSVQANFANADWDTPGDMVPPAGYAGWTKGDGALLVYDEHDVWSLAPDGSGGRRLTDGAAERVAYRYARTDDDADGIDASKSLYFSLYAKRLKKYGFARLSPGRPVERLALEDARLGRLTKADSALTYAFTRERFDDSPDWFVGAGDLRGAKQISKTNAFQGDYAWGRAELVDFKSSTGRALQAALFYPANFDATRKYPMIVYPYELRAQSVHDYVAPSDRSYYNINVWTANGYFVLLPDIVFRARDPGIATLEALEPAVRAITARGIVDSAKVGLVGHSWGGYEAAFVPTRTHIFAASVAGAAITNFLSFPGAIHWSPGIAEFDHWETGQGRMEVPPWEDPEAYLRNSPIAKVHELRTPMLLMFGDADGTVDWHQGIEFYNFARRAGRENVVMLVYPGEDHGLRKKENQIDYHRRINQWFGHWLKGEPQEKWMRQGQTWLERKALLEPAK